MEARYKPSSLLPLIASTAACYRTQQEWLNSPYRIYTPWALADAARVALTYGTESGRSDAADEDLLGILDACNRSDNPFRRDHDLHAFLLRMADEQLTWQTSDYETLARTAAIFTQTPPGRPMECLLPGWDTEVFGCSLREYVGTVQMVWASAFGCAGRFDLALFADVLLLVGHHDIDAANLSDAITATAAFRQVELRPGVVLLLRRGVTGTSRSSGPGWTMWTRSSPADGTRSSI